MDKYDLEELEFARKALTKSEFKAYLEEIGMKPSEFKSYLKEIGVEPDDDSIIKGIESIGKKISGSFRRKEVEYLSLKPEIREEMIDRISDARATCVKTDPEHTLEENESSHLLFNSHLKDLSDRELKYINLALDKFEKEKPTVFEKTKNEATADALVLQSICESSGTAYSIMANLDERMEKMPDGSKVKQILSERREKIESELKKIGNPKEHHHSEGRSR
jgi:hypothetical protein